MEGTVAGSLERRRDRRRALGRRDAGQLSRARAQLTLEPSTIGGLAIQSAALDGDYHEQVGDIRTLEIVGRDVNLKASGTLALNDTGQSNLTVHADSPSLEEIGKLFDSRSPASPRWTATVTGNRRELQARGTVSGDGLEVQATTAR